ncbi:MAG: adenylyltransferase/cytidyltransferase family protein [Lachnospiraceae bacterium]|nr:adenylyltransferase/cytidyltransferase family protein [Lachnospiraceae bacterium]MDE7202554.1 adenylyltransferase/cytidyltransferase family protein [Lachnospiraceae bacterium]
MTSVYELAEIPNLPQMAYRHFMDYEDEVLYLLSGGKMAGVLSIGDLERYYVGQKREFKINQHYIALNKIDFGAAADFFRTHKTINEMPVIADNGELLGVIRGKKEKYLRNGQRHSLRYARNGGVCYVRDEIERFINMTKARVVLYTYSNSSIVKNMNVKEYGNKKRHGNCTGTYLWKGLSSEEWKAFWQSEYSEEFVQEFQKERAEHTPVLMNGVASYSDRKGKFFHFKDGYRVTPDNPLGMNRRIIMFGPCIVVGAYCRDDQTIEAYLQSNLIKDGYMEWGVLNRGAYSPEQCYGHLFIQELSGDDIVMIICEEQWKPDKYLDRLVLQGDLTLDFLRVPNLADYLVDIPSHCNYIVNQQLAERIYKDIRQTGLLDTYKETGVPERLQDYYINWDVHEYFIKYFKQYGLHKESGDVQTGAVVMNCNPFTKGHRYLIEQALDIVDKLYLFVVEEDKSYFKFEDRFNMVKAGVSDLENIHVVPSGKYVISKDTFAQYFEKECVQSVESMDYDLYIFGAVVAAELGIQYRFVGEEPFDKVTRQYNETMKRILPGFGVEVIEFPRNSLNKNGEIISATLVRKAIKEKDMDMIEKLCPNSTCNYLKKCL